jgi:hypothetical protein
MLKPARQMMTSCVQMIRGLPAWLADWISGERSPRHHKCVVVAVFAVAGLGGWAALHSKVADEITPARLMPTPRLDFTGVVHGFSPAELKIALPTIRLNSCLLAEAAVRHALRPAFVGFQSCGDLANFNLSISDDLTEISVSGIADVGPQRKPFTVVMQHQPSSLGIEGLIINAIRIGPDAAHPAAPSK